MYWQKFPPCPALVALALLFALGAGCKPAPTDTPATGPQQAAQEELADRARRIRGDVAALSRDIGPRHPASEGSLEAAAAHIDAVLAAAGLRARVQRFAGEGVLSPVVVAQVRGSNTPGDIVLLGAHFDTVQTGPGANDNASGVAVVLEAARILARTFAAGQAPGCTVRLAFFSGEEAPFFGTEAMGSLRHLRWSLARNERVRLALLADSVGYFCREPGCQQDDEILELFESETGDFYSLAATARGREAAGELAAALAQEGISAQPFTAVWGSWAANSDLAPFLASDAAAVLVTDTSGFRHPGYHGPKDTAETLDYRAMARLAAAMAEIAARHAGF